MAHPPTRRLEILQLVEQIVHRQVALVVVFVFFFVAFFFMLVAEIYELVEYARPIMAVWLVVVLPRSRRLFGYLFERLAQFLVILPVLFEASTGAIVND